MKRILSKSILSHLFQFADPPAGDPGAGGGGGGGGGPAVLDPPSAADQDILDFKAPGLDDIDLSGDSPTPPPKPPAAGDPPPKPPAAPAKPPVAPAKPPAAGDPPAKQLRDELEAKKTEIATLAAERDALKARLDSDDPRLIAANADLAAAKKESAAHQAKMKEYETHAIIADPRLSPEITQMNADHDKAATAFYRAVPETNRDTINALITEYHKLPFGKEGYAEARAAFENKVNAALGGAEGQFHRKTDRTLEFIEKTHDFILDRGAKMQDVQKNAISIARKRDAETFTSRVAHFDGLITKAFEVPEDVKNDPLNPRSAMAAFDRVIKPEQVKQLDANIPEFAKLVLAGIRPPDEDDPTMTPELIAERTTESLARFTKAQDHAADVLVNGMRALRRFPYLMKELARLKEKVGEKIEEDPGDPTKAGGDPKPGDDPVDDLKNFKAPDLDTVHFA